MMSWRAAMALAICLVGQFAMAAPAAGAGWPLCESAEVLLPFSATYTRPDGTTSTHSGVDLPAPVGASVLCVEAGTLTFAGPVPSANGGTVLAATVESATGERWSFMPLSSIEVEEGAWVGEGEPLGVLAETGDPSSPQSHIHVGLRRGDLYVDPMAVLVSPVVEEPGTSETEPLTAPTAGAAPQERTVEQASDGTGATPVVVPGQVPVSVSQVEVPVTRSSSAAHQVPVTDQSTEDVEQSCQTNEMGQASAAPSPGSSTAGAQATVALKEAEFATAHAVGSSRGAGTSGAGLPASSRLSPYSRIAVAIGCLLPIAAASLVNRFRSGVAELGECVAAAVGR